jgi:uncharacterized protein HemY
VTEIELLLSLAKSLLPGRPAQAGDFASKALSLTRDPRLRVLILPAISAIERRDVEAARKWLDRATEHHQTRRMIGVRGCLALTGSVDM